MKKAADYLVSVKVVAFDFDETLVDEAFSLRRRWQETLKAFSHLSDKLEKTFFLIFDSKSHKEKTHLDETLQKLGLPQGHKEPMLAAFFAAHGEERVYEKVRKVLLLLKQKGLRVGIITDGRQDYQEARLRRAGLYNLFDFFYYGDVHKKPDPAFFRMCIRDEKIKPSELLYVGDHVARDIEGALTVGAKACWISQESDESCPEGALQFKTMYDFYQWLMQA